jgi:hypothetical protein
MFIISHMLDKNIIFTVSILVKCFMISLLITLLGQILKCLNTAAVAPKNYYL